MKFTSLWEPTIGQPEPLSSKNTPDPGDALILASLFHTFKRVL
jgi:hypothetical protein